jgi:hypothetical protein
VGSSPTALTMEIKHLGKIARSDEMPVWAACWQINCRARWTARRFDPRRLDSAMVP